MPSLTAARDTRELLPPMSYELTAGGTVYAGALVARNAAGAAVAASDAAGIVVLGRAENSAVSGEKVRIRTGIYIYDNGTSTEALTGADIGKTAFVVDDHTVGAIGGTNGIPAGKVLDVTSEGVALEVIPAQTAGADTSNSN